MKRGQDLGRKGDKIWEIGKILIKKGTEILLCPVLSLTLYF
jgi:hypothetical protein